MAVSRLKASPMAISLHSLTLDRAPRWRDWWSCSHGGDPSALCLSRVGLNVSKPPERGRRGSFTHHYCHDNCCKGLVCDWCFRASFRLASCHAKEIQPFLHGAYSCEEFVAEWYMKSMLGSHVLLSDGATFYFVVRQFAVPLPIYSILLYHTIAWLTAPSFHS